MDKFPRKPSGEFFLKSTFLFNIVVSGESQGGRKPCISIEMQGFCFMCVTVASMAALACDFYNRVLLFISR
jgi:hypothetical protein